MTTDTFRQRTAQSGTGLIEVVIATALIVFVITGIGGMYRLVMRSTREVVKGAQSSLLAEEGVEAARILRDNAWRNIASSTPGTAYTLAWAGGTWSLTQTPSLIGGVFDRRISFARVYRDADDDIAASGTLDPNTYRVDVSVSWDNGSGTTTRTLSSYLGNIFE